MVRLGTTPPDRDLGPRARAGLLPAAEPDSFSSPSRSSIFQTVLGWERFRLVILPLFQEKNEFPRGPPRGLDYLRSCSLDYSQIAP